MFKKYLGKGKLTYMRVPLFLCLLLLFGCGGNAKKARSEADSAEASEHSAIGDRSNTSITCWGIGEIEFGDDPEALKEKAGDKNVSTDSLFLEGTFERLITRVWPETEKEITVVWKEEKPPFKSISSLKISRPDSPYQFDNGIKIGTDIQEIVKLNNKDIKLFGFGWDYGGTFISFEKGRLEGDMPCFGGVFRLDTEAVEGAEEILGDKEIISSEPTLKNYKVILSEITVSDKD